MIDKSSLLKSQGSLYLEFIPKDGLFHKMLLLSLMGFLTGWCNLGHVGYLFGRLVPRFLSRDQSDFGTGLYYLSFKGYPVRILVTPICNYENAMLNDEHAITNIPSSVLKHQLSKTKQL